MQTLINENTATTKTLSAVKHKNLYQISFLRAIAAISVCFFHFSRGMLTSSNTSNYIFKAFSYGYLGVDVFFIISGFIICYSLPSNYRLQDFGTFLKKRIIRVEPPYLVSIIFILAVAYITAIFTHNPVTFSWLNLLYHIGYINNFTSNNYINVVYWTLGIEFQFYLIIGLLFSLIDKSIYWLTAIIAIFLTTSFIRVPNTMLIFEQLPLFCLGILLYFINYKTTFYKPILLLLIAITFSLFAINNLMLLFTGVFVSLVILIPFHKNRIIDFFSRISYSLYLIHVPIGGRVINIASRFVKNDVQRYLAIVIAFIVSVVVAYLFHIAIEKWTTNLSKKIRYTRAA